MGVRSGIAKTAGGALTWGLRNVAKRPAGNLPGKVAVAIDPHIIGNLRSKMRKGSIVVVGTNGKTTVTNLLADVLEAASFSVICNRTGANLDSGIASTLIQADPADWGVLECDELWSAKVVPELQATYLLLLNLFRDQLDRCGEIDRIQDAIVSALVRSPSTTLIYNADDPLCAFIAKRVGEERAASGTSHGDAAEGSMPITFGVTESMNLAQNAVADATMCQVCSHMFSYEFRQYGQLGPFVCENCGFKRPELDYAASNIDFKIDGLSFDVTYASNADGSQTVTSRVSAPLAGSYMVYNLLGVFATANSIGAPVDSMQKAINAFDPQNGRLQRYDIDGHSVLLNLAKNPTGFNQNLRIVAADKGPKAVAFFINDQIVDGRDISWIWDIDFEELVAQQESGLVVFAGGSRRNDLQVRLKYAGVNALLVDGVEDIFANELVEKDLPIYAIANYSALPPVHAKLNEMAKAQAGLQSVPKDEGEHADASPSAEQHADEGSAADAADAASAAASPDEANPIVIAHILPDLLNLYGDGGNIRILEQRLAWRGIPAEVRRIHYGESVDLGDVDLMFLGGGPDREQTLASTELSNMRDDIQQFLDEDGVLLAICGGYQILGRIWLLGDDEVPGLSLLDIETKRPGTSADRLVDNVALETSIASAPVIGYENHAGRTYLDEGVQPFGRVVSKTGKGNNDAEGAGAHADGVLQGNVLGTYLHGPLLSKNPEVADWLLARAIERNARRTGNAPYDLGLLDDAEELAANAFMAKKLI